MNKIKVGTVVEIQGDGMARILWDQVRDKLFLPHLNIALQTYDLSIENRVKTKDAVLKEALEAVKKYKVGVKGSVSHPTDELTKSLNITFSLENANIALMFSLGCTSFREPIFCRSIPKAVKTWEKPIIVARHTQFDQCRASEINVRAAGKLEMVFTSAKGEVTRTKIKEMKAPGVAMAMFNTDESITNFAKCCFQYALERELPLILTTKHTIVKIYDGRFKKIFDEMYANEYDQKFKSKQIKYSHMLVDELMGKIVKSEGGFIWACKGYDGDVQSDVIAQGYGSSGLMQSKLISPDGDTIVDEVFHGTIPAIYDLYLQGKETSANPMSTIFTWANGLQHRAKIESNGLLDKFCETMKETCINIVESGTVTEDIASLMKPKDQLTRADYMETFDYLEYIDKCFRNNWLS